MPGTGNKCMYYAMNIAMHIWDIPMQTPDDKFGMKYGADELKQHIADAMYTERETILKEIKDETQREQNRSNIKNSGKENVRGGDLQLNWWAKKYKMNTSVLTLQLWDKTTEYPELASYDDDFWPLIAVRDNQSKHIDSNQNKAIFINSINYNHFLLVFEAGEWHNIRQKIEDMQVARGKSRIIQEDANNYRWLEED